MPTALHSFIKEPDRDRILVEHTFFGKDDDEARKWKKHHLEACEYYRAAEAEGRTIEILEDIDELPEFNEYALNEFLDLADEYEDLEADYDEEEPETEEEE